MKNGSEFKTMVGCLIKKKYSKAIIFLSIILIMILCLYLMSGENSRLIMAVSVQNGTTTGQPVMLNIESNSIVSLKGNFQFDSNVFLNCIKFSPNNKLIAHLGAPLQQGLPLYIFDTEKNLDTQLTTFDMTGRTSGIITSFTWIDNKHLLFTEINTIYSADNMSASQFNSFNIEDISTKKVTTIKEPDSDLIISCVAYSPEHNKVYLSEVVADNNSSLIDPDYINNIEAAKILSQIDHNFTDNVYECSPDMKKRSLLFSIKNIGINNIFSVPGTNTILFSTNKSLHTSSDSKSILSKYPTTINTYDIKTKKLQKIYETPAPYPYEVDFAPYSKNKVFMQQLGTSNHKYFKLDIKNGKCKEINLVNMPSNTQFAAFSFN